MRVMITGASGQLAGAIRRTWVGHDLLCPEESVLDLANREAIHSVVVDLQPQVVINAGALTQVDRCEEEPELAMLINGKAVGWLAEACKQNNALLVQISTDYVFDGTANRPYRVDDLPNPRSVYGQSKLLGEQEALKAPEHLIVRTAWLYEAWGKNFLLTMLNAARSGRRLKVVADQFGSPTTCRSLARQLRIAVEEHWRGLVHGTCQGQTSWHGFAAEIFRQTGVEADLSPCLTVDYPLPAPRPAYSVLDGSSRIAFGRDVMPGWSQALAEVVADLDR